MNTFIALLLCVCSSSASAGLGSTPASLGPSSGSSAATVASLRGATYTDQKTTLDSGTEVHEYLNAEGIVFAVSWSGPFLPDLKELLGTHFESLLDQSRKQAGRGHSHVGVRHDDVIIYSGGRMGAFEGKAWAPALLPAGFDIINIR